MKIHLRKADEQYEHLAFSYCGRCEHKGYKSWQKQLTNDRGKVTCKLCMRRLHI